MATYQNQYGGSGQNYPAGMGGPPNTGMSSDPRDMDPYQVLGVPRHATPDQIKKAYKRLALKTHPDRIRGDDRAKAEANERFARIAHAYELLTRGHNEGGGGQYRQHQPDAADMGAGFGGGGIGGGFPQYQQQQQPPFMSPFMGMMGGFGGGSGGFFGGLGGMGDPFGSVFRGMPGGAFGGMGGSSMGAGGSGSAFPNFSDPFDLFRQVFGSDFAVGPMDSIGQRQNTGMVTGNGMFSSFLGGPMATINAAQGIGNFTSFTYSSSTSSGGAGPGGTVQSISTTTTIENGKAVTRTEQTMINPDGTRRTVVVDPTGDEIGEQSPVPRLMDGDKTKGATSRALKQPAPKPAHKSPHRTHKRKFEEVTRCLKCCFPTVRKRRRLDPGPPARAA